jgi:hypothetical protein
MNDIKTPVSTDHPTQSKYGPEMDLWLAQQHDMEQQYINRFKADPNEFANPVEILNFEESYKNVMNLLNSFTPAEKI